MRWKPIGRRHNSGGEVKEGLKLSEQAHEELRQKILGYLATVSKAKNRDVARAVGEEKRLVDKAIAELGKEGKIEYIYLDTSYVKLKDK